MHRFLEGAADGHGLADGFHRGGQNGVGGREFLEGETWDLGDDVVDGRLEGGGRLAGDVVADLVERVADGELGGDFSDRETSGLGGEGGGTGDAGIHLDDDHASGLRVGGELDVRAAGFHADFANHGEGGIAHDLVFAITERLDRRDGNRVTSVNAHGIKVFDRANDHAVVGMVAHDFHFKFFPAEQRFLDEHFADGREIEAASDDFLKLLAIVGNAATLTTEGEGGTDDKWVAADHFGDGASFLHGVRGAGLRHIETDLEHGVFETLAVFAFVDGIGIGADHAHAVFVEGTRLEE